MKYDPIWTHCNVGHAVRRYSYGYSYDMTIDDDVQDGQLVSFASLGGQETSSTKPTSLSTMFLCNPAWNTIQFPPSNFEHTSSTLQAPRE
jgi:hypothetical protein